MFYIKKFFLVCLVNAVLGGSNHNINYYEMKIRRKLKTVFKDAYSHFIYFYINDDIKENGTKTRLVIFSICGCSSVGRALAF